MTSSHTKVRETELNKTPLKIDSFVETYYILSTTEYCTQLQIDSPCCQEGRFQTVGSIRSNALVMIR